MRPESTTFLQALAALFPDEVVCAAGEISQAQGGLMPAETAGLAAACEKRQQEFTAGRVLARRALAVLGVKEYALAADAERLPIWPAGIVGCISHSHEYCGVAAARQETARSLGCDLERIPDFDAKLFSRICTDAEMEQAKSLPENAALEYLALVFSIKECFYKAQYPLTRKKLYFRQAQCEITAANTFRVGEHAPAGQARDTYPGKYAIWQGYVLTGLIIK